MARNGQSPVIASAEAELAEEDRIAFENLEKAVAWFHEKIRSLLPRVKWKPDSFAMADLKGNQGTLHDEAQNFFAQAEDVGYAEAACTAATSYEKGHGRIEERKVIVTSQLDWLDERVRERWQDLNSLVEVTCRREVKDKISEEKRYYISNLIVGPEKAGNAVRSHWGVENHLHWTMDVVFLEDESQAATGHAAENLAVFRRMAHNLIKGDRAGLQKVVGRQHGMMIMPSEFCQGYLWEECKHILMKSPWRMRSSFDGVYIIKMHFSVVAS